MVHLIVSNHHFAIAKSLNFHDPFSFLREVKQSLKKNSKEDLWHTLLILDAGSAVNSYSFAPISHIPTKKAESSWNIENGSQQTSTSIRAKISVKAKHILNICVKLDKNLPKLFNSCLKVALKKNFMFYFSTVRFFHFLNFLSFWKWKYHCKSIFSVYSYIPITEQDVVMQSGSCGNV